MTACTQGDIPPHTIPNHAIALAGSQRRGLSHRDHGAGREAGEPRSRCCCPLSMPKQYGVSSAAWSVFKLVSRRIISLRLALA